MALRRVKNWLKRSVAAESRIRQGLVERELAWVLGRGTSNLRRVPEQCSVKVVNLVFEIRDWMVSPT